MSDLDLLAQLAKPRLTKYIPGKPFAKQIAFMMLRQTEALYGGSLGSGKSQAVLMSALQYVDVPGYSALLLRKTLADLKQSGALLDRMLEWMSPWLRSKEVVYKAQDHKFLFPTFDKKGNRMPDATIQFGYIGQSNAFTRYQGIELNLCVDPSTLVVMSSSRKSAIDVRVGDRVKTLIGDRRVSRIHRIHKDACAFITPFATQIQGVNHRVLSSPSQTDECSSTSHDSHEVSLQQTGQKSLASVNLSSSQLDQLPPSLRWLSFQDLSQMETSSFVEDGQNDCEAFGGVSLEDLLPPKLFQSLKEHQELAPLLEAFFRLVHRENVYDLPESQQQDYLASYLACLHRYDEFRNEAESQNLDYPPLSTCEFQCFSYDVSSSKRCNRLSTTLVHPYSGQELGHVSSKTSLALIIPIGKRDLVDLTIEEASHYFTVHGVSQLVNMNCVFDELTQHVERDYEYLFTRLRKCVCPVHTERDSNENPIYHDDCELCQWAKMVPTKMRATCNPDGIGFAWVKERFAIGPDVTQEQAEAEGRKVKWIGKNKDRPFLPATFADNPYLDHKSYGKNLKDKLSPELYEALVEGSWGVVPNVKIKRSGQRFYSGTGAITYLGPNLNGRIINMRTGIQEVFTTVDTATTSTEAPGAVDLFPTIVKTPSSTAIATWALTKCFNLLWLHLVHVEEEIPEVVALLNEQYQMWRPEVVIVEDNGVGKGVAQYAARAGMNIQGLHKDTDKLVNATQAILQMNAGRIWFPQGNTAWVPIAEEEIFTWQGHPSQKDDIVDVLSMACNHVNWDRAEDAENYTTIEIAEDPNIPKAITNSFLYDQWGH